MSEVAEAATTVYKGESFVCKKFGHPLSVIYTDSYNALIIERNRLAEQVERLETKLAESDKCSWPRCMKSI